MLGVKIRQILFLSPLSLVCLSNNMFESVLFTSHRTASFLGYCQTTIFPVPVVEAGDISFFVRIGVVPTSLCILGPLFFITPVYS